MEYAHFSEVWPRVAKDSVDEKVLLRGRKRGRSRGRSRKS